MTVRDKPSKRYDGTPGQSTIGIKSVTYRPLPPRIGATASVAKDKVFAETAGDISWAVASLTESEPGVLRCNRLAKPRLRVDRDSATRRARYWDVQCEYVSFPSLEKGS